MTQFDVLAIGHVTRDHNIIGDKAEVSPGGAVYYGGMTLLALGLRVMVITRLKEEDFGLLDGLKGAGAVVHAVAAPETSGIENFHPDPNSDKRICHLLGFAGPFQIVDILPVKARLYYIGTVVPGEVDLPFLKEIASRGPLAVDAQGFLRKEVNKELIADRWDQARDVLPLIHYLKVDNREAATVTGETDRYKAAKILRDWGAKEVVLTHQGGVMVQIGDEVVEAPFHPRSLAGRTGRGDTCFSSYFGRRLLGDSPAQAVRFAAALTTLKLEEPGPFRRSLDEVQALIQVYNQQWKP